MILAILKKKKEKKRKYSATCICVVDASVACLESVSGVWTLDRARQEAASPQTRCNVQDWLDGHYLLLQQ